MNLLRTLRPLITGAQLVAYTVLTFRLFSTKLNSVYRWFSAYILYELARVILFGFMNPRTNLYTAIYFVTQPITWCLYLLVILELYQLVLRNHPGIAKFGRRAVLIGLSVSTAISLATLFLDLQHPSPMYVRIATYVLIERLIVSSLLLFLLLLTAFLTYFPVPVNRNTVVHTRIFACYLTVKAALLIFRNMIVRDELAAMINLVVQLLSTACLVAWSVLLTRSGESVERRRPSGRDREAEERLIAQLDAINSTLLGSAKK